MAVGGYGNTGGSFTPSSNATTATFYNFTAALSATEYSQALPADTKHLILKTRSNATLKLSYTSGQSGSLFVTIPGGAVYSDINFYSSLTLYFQVDQPNTIVEIIAYT